MRTLQEKYNGVLNESFSKAQFVRDARQQLPNLITQFNGFNDTVTILKNKGMIQEAKQEVPEYDPPAPGVSLEAQERGIDYELQGMGVDTAVDTPTQDQYNKAKDKAFKNLKKDPNHYLNLLSGDSKNVDKHDQMVPLNKKNTVDTFNGLKKAELKEGVGSLKEYVVDVIGLIKKKYPEVSNSAIKDFIKMHFADIQAGADPMDEFEEFLSVNPEILNADMTENRGKDIDMSSKDGYIAFIDNEDIFASYGLEDIEDMARELAMNHHDAGPDQDNFVKSFMAAYKEGGYMVDDIAEKKGKDLDGDGDIDSDDYMAAKDAAIKKAMGKNESYTMRRINQDRNLAHRMGKKHWSDKKDDDTKKPESNSDKEIDEANPTGFGTGQGRSKTISKGREERPDLKAAQAAAVKTAPKFVMKNGVPHKMKDGKLVPLTKVSEEELPTAFKTKVNQQVKSPATLALALIDLYKQIQAKEQVDFSKHSVFKRVLGLLQGMADKAGTEAPEQEAPVTEGRRKKMQGGKVVTENDYETGGYVESMGPHLENAIRYIVQVWEEWKDGPMTEPGMVPFAKKDLLRYIDNQLVEMEEANMSEEEMFAQEQLKEGIKHLITNLLNEEVITEAATGNLSKMADTYNDFEGMQSAVNALENIVTDVESYYAKTKDKLQKIYDSFKDIKNAEGLSVGPMLAPAIEAAFRKDLMPVTDKGFTKGLTMPTVKILKPGDIAEEELEEKKTVYSPVNENKKYKYTKRQK